jgi:hypothetical protein
MFYFHHLLTNPSPGWEKNLPAIKHSFKTSYIAEDAYCSTLPSSSFALEFSRIFSWTGRPFTLQMDVPQDQNNGNSVQYNLLLIKQITLFSSIGLCYTELPLFRTGTVITKWYLISRLIFPKAISEAMLSFWDLNQTARRW